MEKKFSKKNIVIVALIALVAVVAISLPFILNHEEKFDGNLTIDTVPSVTLQVNQTAKVSYSVNYSKAVSMFESSNSNVFKVIYSDVENGYIEIQSFSVGDEELTITAQYASVSESAVVSIYVVDEQDSDDDSGDDDKTYDSIIAGASEDFSAFTISSSVATISTVDKKISYSESGKIKVSGTVSAAYIVLDGTVICQLEATNLISGQDETFFNIETSYQSKYLLIVGTNSEGCAVYAEYLLTANN